MQTDVSVAGGSATGFVVVWTRSLVDYEIAGQRFDNTGSPLAGQFRVNAVTTNKQNRPDVGMPPPGSGNGTFIVTWLSFGGEDGESTSIMGQKYFSSGPPFDTNFIVNSYTTGQQSNPFVAVNSDVDFVISYQNFGPGDADGVFARRFSLADSVGSDFRVNVTTTGYQGHQALAWDGPNSFVVVWTSPDAPTGIQRDIYARRFSVNGPAIGAAMRVNSLTTNLQNEPAVAGIGTGDFVVVWHSYHFQPTGYDIFAQRVVGSSLVGPAVQVNATGAGVDVDPQIAKVGPAEFVVVWRGEDGDGDGIFARRLCVARGDANASGQVGVDDVLYLINNLFAGGPAPLQNADVNEDTFTNVGDVLYLINYLFAGGPPPACA